MYTVAESGGFTGSKQVEKDNEKCDHHQRVISPWQKKRRGRSFLTDANMKNHIFTSIFLISKQRLINKYHGDVDVKADDLRQHFHEHYRWSPYGLYAGLIREYGSYMGFWWHAGGDIATASIAALDSELNILSTAIVQFKSSLKHHTTPKIHKNMSLESKIGIDVQKSYIHLNHLIHYIKSYL